MRKVLVLVLSMYFLMAVGSGVTGDHAFELADVSAVTFFSDLLVQFGQLTSTLSTTLANSVNLISSAFSFLLSAVDMVNDFYALIKPVMDAFSNSIIPGLQAMFRLLEEALSGLSGFLKDIKDSLGGLGDKIEGLGNKIKSWWNKVFS